MGKSVKAVRVFFSTFYPEVGDSLIEALAGEFGRERIRYTRSRVVRELYYVEILSDNPARDMESVKRILSKVDDRVYGVKVYAVPREEGSAG